jgi:hypothetical protein
MVSIATRRADGTAMALPDAENFKRWEGLPLQAGSL